MFMRLVLLFVIYLFIFLLMKGTCIALTYLSFNEYAF